MNKRLSIKRYILILSVMICFILTLCVPAIASTGSDGVSEYTAIVAQQEVNYRDIKVELPELTNIGDKADTVKVVANMTYKDEIVRTSEVTKSLSEIDNDSKSFDLKVTDFGKWDVEISFLKDGEVVNTETKEIGVKANSYNIANLSATTPGLIFSLKVVSGDISQDESGNPIPSYLTTDRRQSFDWDNLPENMFTCPFAKDNNKYLDNVAAVKDYVDVLYDIDNNAHFNFFCNDTCPQLEVVSIIWRKNAIPEDNYSLRLITDGSASYAKFKKQYDGLEDAQSKHDEMVEELKAAKAKSMSGQYVNYYDLKYGYLGEYQYALLDVEKDAQWWVVRKSAGDTFQIQDTTFANKAVKDGRITNNYINNLLAAVQNAGKTEEFKALYKFDDSAFEATRSKGKKIMMILGTSKAGETSNPINDYVDLTKAYYGSGYEYYYKGHPGYLPELNPGRAEELTEMGLQILDSSIAAELFVFFDPDISMSGYTSSTFQNSGTEETDCGLYNIRKASAETASGVSDYASKMDFFATDMRKNNVTDESILSAIKDVEHHNYLLELNDTSKYDFGIFDADEDLLYFCKDGKVVDERAIQADEVTDLINGLPTTITLNDESQVTAARAAYDALSDAHKSIVKDEILQKLTSAEATLENLHKQAGGNSSDTPTQQDPKVNDAISAIEAIPESIKASDAATVAAARKAYDSLSDEQKKQVSAETLKKLTDAEAAIDKALVDEVVDKVTALPATVTLDNKEDVAKARAAYDALTDAQKTMVDAETVATLEKAEQIISDWTDYDTAVKAAKKKSVKLISIKAKKGRKAAITWKTTKNVAGYQVRFSTNKSFKKAVKKVTVKNAKTSKKTIKKLKAKRIYYVQVRTIKKIKNKATGETTTVYGKWSNIKKVKARK